MDYTKYREKMISIDQKVIEKAKNIQLLILDVDGVLTDGGIILDENGAESKRFFAQDGHGLMLVRNLDVELAIISGRYSKAVEYRAKDLKFTEVIQNSRDKLGDFKEKFSQKYSLDQVCFVGDDIVDIELMQKVGLSITVPNANYNKLTDYSNWVTPRPGGFGAVRDACDLIVLANNDKKNNK